jgi:hypothetical protein
MTHTENYTFGPCRISAEHNMVLNRGNGERKLWTPDKQQQAGRCCSAERPDRVYSSTGTPRRSLQKSARLRLSPLPLSPLPLSPFSLSPILGIRPSKICAGTGADYGKLCQGKGVGSAAGLKGLTGPMSTLAPGSAPAVEQGEMQRSALRIVDEVQRPTVLQSRMIAALQPQCFGCNLHRGFVATRRRRLFRRRALGAKHCAHAAEP